MNASAPALRPQPHFPVRPRTVASTPAPAAPSAARPAPTGSWRYNVVPRRGWTYFAGLVLSVGLHTALFFSFADSPKPKAVAAAKVEEEVIAIEMPPLAPEEPEVQPTELVESLPETIAVPQLAEVPSLVALNDFNQVVDLRPKAEIDPNAIRQLAIPVNHGRGGLSADALANVFKLSDLDRLPEPVAQPAPTYPPGAKVTANETEVVVIQFIVDADGKVRDPRVISSTNREFERSAAEGVLRWKFKPGLKGGRKVATLMEVPLKFVVTDVN
jgi:protein TonB